MGFLQALFAFVFPIYKFCETIETGNIHATDQFSLVTCGGRIKKLGDLRYVLRCLIIAQGPQSYIEIGGADK